MTFEEKLRDRIAKAAHLSQEKNVLKVILGEVQNKAAKGPVTEEQGYNLVSAAIKTNIEKVMPYLKEGDPRLIECQNENVILATLLPAYLSKQEIMAHLEAANLIESIKTAENNGKAMGLAMGFCKKSGLAVQGDTVQLAVMKLRA